MAMSPDGKHVAEAAALWVGAGVAHYLDAVGVHSWADFAAALAAIYSGLLILQFIWRRVIRPIWKWVKS